MRTLTRQKFDGRIYDEFGRAFGPICCGYHTNGAGRREPAPDVPDYMQEDYLTWRCSTCASVVHEHESLGLARAKAVCAAMWEQQQQQLAGPLELDRA